jgi:oligosaccharide repeat unit polymerase
MTSLNLLLILTAVFIIYLNTSNIISYIMLLVLFMTPACLTADEEVGFVLAISMFMVSAGGYCFNFINKIRIKSLLKDFKERDIKINFNSTRRFILAIYLLSSIAIIGSIYYFMKIGIPLFAEEVGLERLLARHNVQGSYLYQRLFRVILPISCLCYYLYRYEIGKGNKYILFFLIVITSAFLMFTGLRGNLITFMFTPFLILMGMISKKISIKVLFSLFSLGILGGVLISALMYKNSDPIFLIFLILERLGGGATDGISVVIESDVVNNGFYYGSTWINDISSLFFKLGLISAEVLNYSAYIAELMLGERYNGEQAAVYIFGEFYANFGFYGNIIGSFILGLILQNIYVHVLRSSKNLLRISIYSYFQASLIMIIGGPSVTMAIDYIVSIGIFYIIVCTISSSTVSNKKEKINL